MCRLNEGTDENSMIVPPSADDILDCRLEAWNDASKEDQDVWLWYSNELLPCVSTTFKSRGGRLSVTKGITTSDEAMVLVLLDVYKDTWTKIWEDDAEDATAAGGSEPNGANNQKKKRRYIKNIKVSSDAYNELYDKVELIRSAVEICDTWDSASVKWCTTDGCPGVNGDGVPVDVRKKALEVTKKKKRVRTDWTGEEDIPI